VTTQRLPPSRRRPPGVLPRPSPACAQRLRDISAEVWTPPDSYKAYTDDPGAWYDTKRRHATALADYLHSPAVQASANDTWHVTQAIHRARYTGD